MENNEKQTTQTRLNKDDLPGVADETVQTITRRRKKRPGTKTKLPWYVIILPLAALLVILFAFIMEARTNRRPSDEGNITEPSQPQSGVQAELNRLDWIEQDLIPVNRFSRPGIKLETINGIVIHNIGNPGTTAKQNRNYFANLAQTEEREASSNFIICLDGAVIQCIPVDEIAYASNIRNSDTLSIEVCHPDDTGKFTEESYAATIKLTAWLCLKYGLTSDDVIRHFDVQGKECPRYFVVNEDAWELFKAEVALAIHQMR